MREDRRRARDPTPPRSPDPPGREKGNDMSEYGTLTDYITGEAIRPATEGELETSRAAGETGAFDLDDRTVFVAGGGDSDAMVVEHENES